MIKLVQCVIFIVPIVTIFIVAAAMFVFIKHFYCHEYDGTLKNRLVNLILATVDLNSGHRPE